MLVKTISPAFHVFQDVPIDQIKVSTRMREVDPGKVQDLMESISTVGLINPITLDASLNLIAGAHRLSAYQQMGFPTIKAQICDQEDLIKTLMEVDENLVRNELCIVSIAELIEVRERVLTSLGLRKKAGQNQYTIKDTDQQYSTDDLADKLGISTRTYQQRKQISDLIPEVRNALRGTKHARKLTELLSLSRLNPHVQKRVSELVKIYPNETLRYLTIKAKCELYKNKERSDAYFKMKEKWGVPYSVMKFDRENNAIEDALQQITQSAAVKRLKKTGLLQGESLPTYQGFPSHSLFLLDYFVREPGSKILDSFVGKGTNAFAAGVLGMEFYGFELNQSNVDAINDGLTTFFQDEDGSIDFRWKLYCDDGVALEPFKEKEEFFDAVLTDPPYLLNKTEDYGNGDDIRDLSNLNPDEFLEQMDKLFANYKRLIKTSSFKEKRFYPIMMKMNCIRNGSKGLISMDFELMKIAEKNDLTLHDRTIQMLHPTTMVMNPRSYQHHYTIKNWETVLVWIKQ
jgi:ParB-like chromosome segregation protein Spo0J/DNA modification methylase